MKQMSIWQKITIGSGAVIAVVAGLAFAKEYAPWAPRITFAIAAENTVTRLQNNLITLVVLEAQAKQAQDWDQVRRLKVLISAKEREIEEILELKAVYK